MNVNYLWMAVAIVIMGTIFLRISGRRSISQMTVSETILMISIGTLLIQPVTGKNLWVTFLLAAILIATMIVLEFIQVKSDKLETMLTGKAVLVIENGQLNEKNLKKLRMSVDKLEMRLRQKGIDKISDIKWATIEPSGQFGYQLKENKQPATKEDINQLKMMISNLSPNANQTMTNTKLNETDLFTEIKHDDHYPEPPQHLQ